LTCPSESPVTRKYKTTHQLNPEKGASDYLRKENPRQETYQKQLVAVVFGGTVVGEEAFAFCQHVTCVFGGFGNLTERDYTSQFTKCSETAKVRAVGEKE
jgi:hypothetical protein